MTRHQANLIFSTCKLHKRLFGNVYTWAGELRQIDIIEGTTRFAHAATIGRASTKLFEQLASEQYLVGLNADTFSDPLGDQRCICFVMAMDARSSHLLDRLRTRRGRLSH